MPINELRSITTFVKTAELGSLRKAATAQSITPQAASQALAQLEQHLGVRLFHRTTRSMALTEEGLRFLEAAQPALLSLQRAMQTAKTTKDEIAGPLRIVGPRSMFVPVVGPVIEKFCMCHPDVQPDVLLDDRLGNWVEDRVDIGFRIGQSPQDGVIARRLFTLQLIICASPEYLQRFGVPDSLDALGTHKCCAYRSTNKGRVLPWRVKIGDTEVDHPIAPAFCTNDEDVELRSVLAGIAIGQLASVIAASHIRSGRLVPLLTRHVTDHAGFFLYYGSRAAQPVRSRAFIDLAVARLTDNSDFVLSDTELATAEQQGRQLVRA